MAPTDCEPAIELSKKDLEYLLRKKFGPELKVEHFKTEALTKPGDNYGSTILAAEIDYKENGNQAPKKLQLVAKLMPPSEFLRDAFNISITFNKEVRTYFLVSPEHERLQKEKGIPEDEIVNVFPAFYGARTNLKEDLDEKADNSAVLLLENLKPSGYHVGDRRKGLNLQHIQLGVTTLARFHAVTIALKIHKPGLFKETVLKACEKFNLGSKFDIERLITTTVKCVEAISECKPYIRQIEDRIREALKIEFVLSPVPREPFATLLHNDFWVNNMLFKYEAINGKTNYDIPKEMKFVDFQITVYDSPVRDLLFFLFTSSEDGLLDTYLDSLFRLYHEEFASYLEKMDCNPDTFSFQNFEDEIKIYAPREFSHILFILKIVSAENSGAQSLSESDMNMFDSNGGEVYAQKVKSLVQTFVTRGWL